jgi:hypothetical protein
MSQTISQVVGSLGGNIASALIRPTRKFGNLYPDVVMEERHMDKLAITSHPVEKGANISDHAYKEPVSPSIRACWSDASIQAVAALFSGGSLLGAVTEGLLGGPSYSAQAYASVVALQLQRIPMTLVTGKRRYPSMLIESIREVTTSGTEYSLILDIQFKEVIIVTTQSTTLPPATSQANPQQTNSPSNSGTQQPSTVSQDSLLVQGANQFGLPSSSTSFGTVLGKFIGIQ